MDDDGVLAEIRADILKMDDANRIQVEHWAEVLRIMITEVGEPARWALALVGAEFAGD
jgi:hypothetical protein